MRLGLEAGLACDAELMLEVWVVLQLGLCLRLARDKGGALLEFNGYVVGGGLGLNVELDVLELWDCGCSKSCGVMKTG